MKYKGSKGRNAKRKERAQRSHPGSQKAVDSRESSRPRCGVIGLDLTVQLVHVSPVPKHLDLIVEAQWE